MINVGNDKNIDVHTWTETSSIVDFSIELKPGSYAVYLNFMKSSGVQGWYQADSYINVSMATESPSYNVTSIGLGGGLFSVEVVVGEGATL